MKKILTVLFVSILTISVSSVAFAHKSGADDVSSDAQSLADEQEQKTDSAQAQADQNRAADATDAEESYLLQQEANQEQGKTDELQESAQGFQTFSEGVNHDQ